MAGGYINRLLWSSEGGGLFNSPTYPALLAAQKTATAVAASLPLLDVASMEELFLEVILTSFTGGAAPSFQPEWDHVDDAAAPGNVIPLWKPTAATSATNWLALLGTGQGTAPTIASWTLTSVPIGFGNTGRFVWTVTGAPTAIAWVAYLYGKGRM